jgi:hypothetical protein
MPSAIFLTLGGRQLGSARRSRPSALGETFPASGIPAFQKRVKTALPGGPGPARPGE